MAACACQDEIAHAILNLADGEIEPEGIDPAHLADLLEGLAEQPITSPHQELLPASTTLPRADRDGGDGVIGRCR